MQTVGPQVALTDTAGTGWADESYSDTSSIGGGGKSPALSKPPQYALVGKAANELGC